MNETEQDHVFRILEALQKWQYKNQPLQRVLGTTTPVEKVTREKAESMVRMSTRCDSLGVIVKINIFSGWISTTTLAGLCMLKELTGSSIDTYFVDGKAYALFVGPEAEVTTPGEIDHARHYLKEKGIVPGEDPSGAVRMQF